MSDPVNHEFILLYGPDQEPVGMRVVLGDGDGDGDGVVEDLDLDDMETKMETIGELGRDLRSMRRTLTELREIDPAITPGCVNAILAQHLRGVIGALHALYNPGQSTGPVVEQELGDGHQ